MILRAIASLFLISTIFACQSNSDNKNTNESKKLSFESIKGITFHEVRRAFENNVAFNDLGFQQEPEWKLQFLSNDTIVVYSPVMQKMLPFYIYHDHDSYYRFANEWFSIKSISRDSLVFQRLEVKSLRVKNDERSNVYMTFYADDYITKKLKTNIETLRKPKLSDSLFVRKKTNAANLNPLDSMSFYAARNPVKFIPKAPNIKVEKINRYDKLKNESKSYAYLYPEYNIEIRKAYKDFSSTFSAVVDSSGKVLVYDFLASDDDIKENRMKVIQGIADVYLSNLLEIKPGNTLGIPHASLIYLNVKGKAD
jgi:hypothetical protein